MEGSVSIKVFSLNIVIVIVRFHWSKRFINSRHEKLLKLPGSIDGQPFEIIDCDNCELLVLDNTDQVQIDCVRKSKVFIAASSESVFLRDCKDCSFTIACKQLRTRSCSNCDIYLYTKTDPVIESSTNMRYEY